MDALTLAILGIVALIILIALGMNVAMSMLVVGFVGFALVRGFDAAVGILRTLPFSVATNHTFTVIPLFILMGNAVFASGLGNGLFGAASKWFSRMPGSLSASAVVASALFSAVTGSKIATVATIGTVALPECRKAGYDDSISIGAITVSGGLGMIIPPSTVMIVYAIQTEQSISRLFAAGIIPGIILALVIICQIQIMLKMKKGLAPPGCSVPWKERFASLKGTIGVMVLFIIVLAGIFAGFFTITEAAAVGAFFSLVILAIKKMMTWSNLKKIVVNTIYTSGMVFMLIIGAQVFARFMTISMLPASIAGFAAGLEVSRYWILLLAFAIHFFLGMVMDGLAMILLTVPIFFPVLMELGFDPIWYCIIIILEMNVAGITPPVGMNSYVVSTIAKDVPITKIFRYSVPFVLSNAAVMILLVVFPNIATWLPNLFYG